MAKLKDPCPFCKAEIRYYIDRIYLGELPGQRKVACYCVNLKCGLSGVRTLTNEEIDFLLSPKPLEPQQEF